MPLVDSADWLPENIECIYGAGWYKIVNSADQIDLTEYGGYAIKRDFRSICNTANLQDGEFALFAVEDTGPGIPLDLRERVFEPFFRILGTQQSGNGLGLAIVKSAADALGGSVELSERVDGQPGLRFVYRQKHA